MKFTSPPHFLVVGPVKTGTSWLYEQLRFVEGFKMPPAKELRFFSELNFLENINPRNAALLKTYEAMGFEFSPAAVASAKEKFKVHHVTNQQYAVEQKRPLWGWFYRYFPRNWGLVSWYFYTRLFERGPGITTGDISPMYFHIYESVIELIARRFPDIKIVFIIREPLDREWSNIRMNHFSEEGQPPFLIDKYVLRPNRGGDYQRAITNWEKHFTPNRIRYLFYDDLKADPHNFLQQFLEFIQPGAHITHLIKDSVYKGVEKKINEDIKLKLLQKSIPQYQFLAQKFGPGSYPAQWLEDALKQV